MSKVKLQDNLGRVVNINADATKGAIVGVNLYAADGKTLIDPAVFGDDAGGSSVPWDRLTGVPRNLDAFSKISGMGYPVLVAPGQWRMRTFQAGGGISMTNGDGRGGDTVFRLQEVQDTGDGQALVKTTIDQYGRVVATADASTDDLPEGDQLYFTDTRADARVAAGIADHVAESDPHPQYTTATEAAAAAPVQSVVGEQGDVTASQLADALGLGTAATHAAEDFVAAASLATLPNAVDDAAAATAGVAVGAMYRNGSVLCVRIS